MIINPPHPRDLPRIERQQAEARRLFLGGNRALAVLLAAEHMKKNLGALWNRNRFVTCWDYSMILGFGLEPRPVIGDSCIYIKDVQIE